MLDQPLEDLRSVSQMICGGADVGPDRLPHQSLRVVPEVGRQQRFHGWPNAVDDRAKVPRLAACRLLKFFQGRQNCPALGVPENHHQPRAVPAGGELDAADLRWGDDVSGNADDEQVAKALIENEHSLRITRRTARLFTNADARAPES